MGNPGEDSFCDVATESLCGFSQCCSSCEKVFEEAEECVESWVSLATFGKCEIDCAIFDGGNGGTSTAGCGDSLRAYTDCVAKNPFQCGLCAINNLPDSDADEFCEAAGESVCGFGACCAPCKDEFDDFDECLEMFAFSVTFGQCQ